ncbi:MAG: CDP-alcohol phosphatidyltransferase family protein [Phycisphaerales bacterium]|nr:MAG: CDP-alcohol phosphatidyltransferase family protein [Phycisphaerales bacterium]
MTTPHSHDEDFDRFRRSGMAAGATKAIGTAFANARTRVAAVLVRLGARPNHVTVAGFLITLVAAGCFVVGTGHHAPYERAVQGVAQSYWPLLAALFLILAGACDMLDGAVARLSGGGSAFGGVLDSTLDRFSDIAVYLGMCIHFAGIGNLTYATLAVVAMCNGYMISYVKARAEDFVDDCSVGYWLRGERCAGLVLASLCSHVPAWLWLQATTPLATVVRRLWHTHSKLREADGRTRRQSAPAAPPGIVLSILRGETPRGSAAYDLVSLITIGWFVAAPWVHPFFYGGSDPLRRILSPILAM